MDSILYFYFWTGLTGDAFSGCFCWSCLKKIKISIQFN